MGSLLEYIPPILSSLFKLSVYIYLRVIPYTLGKFLIPSLYTIYASASLLCPKQQPFGGSVSKPQYTKPTLSSSLRAVLFSFPTTSSSLRALSLLLNTTILLLALDFTTYPLRYPAHDVTFARVGAIDHKSAKLLIRYPLSAHNSTALKVVFRPSRPDAKDVAWLDGPVVHLNDDADWTNFTVLKGLWPKTSYEYRLTTANPGLDFLPYPPTPFSFKTFPDPRLVSGSHFRFIATSCILPNFPYVPGMGDRIKGFDLLFDYIWKNDNNSKVFGVEKLHEEPTADYISKLQTIVDSNRSFDEKTSDTTGAPVEFLLTMGDFIYADVPTYFGDSIEAYQRLYRRMYASPSFRNVYERLPTIHIYDDHEIINNYSGNLGGPVWPYNNASQAFRRYIADANYDSPKHGLFYYDFRYGDVAYFVMDTRRDRTNDHGSLSSPRTMLGEAQLKDLLIWLSEVNQTATFKFVITSVPFTSLWQFDAQTDSWAAYAEEKKIILDALHTVPNVILLSGDRHEFAIIEYNSELPWSYPIREISTSPLNMFYVPFVKTLSSESKTQVTQTRQRSVTHDNGTITKLHEKIILPAEKVLKHIAHGNHKWSTFEVDSRNFSRPILKLETMIDGNSAFRWNISGEPMYLRKGSALSNFVPQSFQTVLDKIGLVPSRWF